MSILRKLAIKILDVVERKAPAHSSTWVLAIRGEMGCIAGDWQAFRWAMGSVRILLQPSRRAELPPLDEMCHETNKIIDQIGNMRLHASIWTLIAVLNIYSGHHSRWLWIGCSLSFLTLLIQTRRMKTDKIPTSTDPESEREQYRQALNFQYQLWSGSWYWARSVFLLAGCFVNTCYLWKAHAYTSTKGLMVCFDALILAFCLVGVKKRAGIRQKLDALLANKKL